MSNPDPVTTRNWSGPPHNRWSFQHVQELFPTCRLARGDSDPTVVAERPRRLLPIEFVVPDGSSRTVGDFLGQACCDALVAIQDGHVVAEHYFNGMTRSSHHLLNSVTKSFVGMLAGIAVDRGLLDPSEPITRYLPELDTPAWHGTTTRHLLDMTAAVRYAEDYSDPETDFWQEAAVVGWRPALVNATTPASLLEFARSMHGQDMENGAMFHYRTIATNVIGMILERTMGARLATLLETELWSKLATAHDASIVVDRRGFPYVGAGMSATARDVARFGLMMIRDGVLDGRPIVPASWIADTARGDATSKACFAGGAYGALMPGWHYRNQVWVANSDPAVMLAIGIHGQFIYMDKGRDLVVVILSSHPAPLEVSLYMETLAMIMAIASSLEGSPGR
jgi:CubicO group peptidase (beta-lactamase class C family)